MDVLVNVIPNGMSMIIAILGVGIYLIFLLIKALRIYIKKNA